MKSFIVSTFKIILLVMLSPALSMASTVVINEIAWMGTINSSYD